MMTQRINPVCYRCICRVCGQVGCPHRSDRRHRCQICMENNRLRPIIDCENFYFHFFKKYKVRRVFRKPSIKYVDRFNNNEVCIMLAEILRILKSDLVPGEDVNCVKYKCLCLRCAKAGICSIKCKNCKDYKGSAPVIRCAWQHSRYNP